MLKYEVKDMKNICKKLSIILLVLILLFSINTKVYALGEIFSYGQGFIGAADSNEVNMDMSDVASLSGYLYNILLSLGVVIAVIIATVLGVQFMLSEAEGQAKVKEMLIPFIIGCIIIFGGFGIWKIALQIGESVESVSLFIPNSSQYVVAMKK